MQNKKFPLLPNLIFAVVYLSLFWFADDGMVLVLIGIFSMFWVFPATTVAFLVWTGISYTHKKYSPKYKRFVGLYFTFIICFFLGLKVITPFSFDQYRKQNLAYDRAVGEKTVQALEQYKMKYKTYPLKLDELVPEYLDSVPVTRLQRPLNYQAGQESFYLRYPDKKTGQCYEKKIWTSCDFGL